MRNKFVTLALSAFLASAAGCGPQAREAPTWKSRVLYEGGALVARVAVGDADPDSPGLEILVADAAGVVSMFTNPGAEPKREAICDHGAALGSLLIADVDPTAHGMQVYAGGFDEAEKGGAILQILRREGKTAVKRIWTGASFPRAIVRLEPEKDSRTPELAVATAAGEVIVLHPVGGDGKWQAKSIHKETGLGGPEGGKINEMLSGRIAGGHGRTLFLAAASGRGVLLDADAPAAAAEIHLEKGGIEAAALEGPGSILVACGNGRVLRIAKKGEEWGWVEIYRDEASLRAIATGDFALDAGKAPIAVFGRSKNIIALEVAPGTWKPSVLFTYAAEGRSLAAADLIRGNGSDEIALGGDSGRVVLLYRE